MNTNQLILSNVEYYKDYEEFETNKNISQEEFNEMQEDGHIANISLGTYNGSTNVFHNREIADLYIIEAIQVEISESEFEYMFEEKYEHEELMIIFTEFYDVVVIKDEIYTIQI